MKNAAEMTIIATARERLAVFAALTVTHRETGKATRPAKHHLRWIEALEALERGDLDNLLILSPPGSAKSTICSVIFPTWFLGRGPGRHVVLVSRTDTQAVDFAGAVREMFDKSREVGLVFPGARPSEGREWSGSAFVLERPTVGDKDPSFFAAGVMGGVVTRRADIVILDDVVDMNNQMTPAARRKVDEWVAGQVLTRLGAGGRLLVVGSRWAPGDLYHTLCERGLFGGPRRAKVVVRAITENGGSYWPSEYSIAMLEHIRSMLPPWRWRANYLQDPTGGLSDRIDPSKVRRYAPSELPKDLRIVMAVDPCATGAGDYFVALVGGIGADGRRWVIAADRGLYSFEEQVSAVVRMWERFKPAATLIEAVAAQGWLKQRLDVVAPQIRPVPITRSKSKDALADEFGTTAAIERGELAVPEGMDWLVDEIAGRAENDDGWDCVKDLWHPTLRGVTAVVCVPEVGTTRSGGMVGLSHGRRSIFEERAAREGRRQAPTRRR